MPNEVTNLVQGQDGGKQLEVCTFVRTERERRSTDTGNTLEQRVATPPAETEGATTTRMCQKYKAMQPEVRTCEIWDCVWYVAVADSGWFTAKNLLIGIGIVGAIVLTAGAGAVVIGGAAMAGGAGAAIGIGGGVATVGLGGASLISGDVDDYSRGTQVKSEQIKKCDALWSNDGVPVAGETVGQPYPC
jgi:hypothetical protein